MDQPLVITYNLVLKNSSLFLMNKDVQIRMCVYLPWGHAGGVPIYTIFIKNPMLLGESLTVGCILLCSLLNSTKNIIGFSGIFRRIQQMKALLTFYLLS